jgi:uncharacterized protein
MEQNNNTNDKSPETKSRTSTRGFASMDPKRQREIASEGGRAAHIHGTAHEWTSEEARQAGRKGGQANRKTNQAENRDQVENSGESLIDY